MHISVVVPCYNEEAVIRETHRRLIAVLEELRVDGGYEVIYVNDGSDDETQEIIRDLQSENEFTRVLLLSRNFGHQIAVTAGLENAAGECVVIIDADLQDPPEMIPEMVARWKRKTFRRR